MDISSIALCHIGWVPAYKYVLGPVNNEGYDVYMPFRSKDKFTKTSWSIINRLQINEPHDVGRFPRMVVKMMVKT